MSREEAIRNAIYTRQQFLDEVEVNEDDYDEIMENSTELVKFISSFEKGDYYGEKIKELIYPPSGVFWIINGNSELEVLYDPREANCEYRQKLVDNKNEIQSLLVELLSCQSWADAESKTYNIKGDLVMGDKLAGDKIGRDKIQ